jgi:hypothetical protein
LSTRVEHLYDIISKITCQVPRIQTEGEEAFRPGKL